MVIPFQSVTVCISSTIGCPVFITRNIVLSASVKSGYTSKRCLPVYPSFPIEHFPASITAVYSIIPSRFVIIIESTLSYMLLSCSRQFPNIKSLLFQVFSLVYSFIIQGNTRILQDAVGFALFLPKARSAAKEYFYNPIDNLSIKGSIRRVCCNQQPVKKKNTVFLIQLQLPDS